MEHGFVRVAAGVPSIRTADCAYNALQARALMEQAAEHDVKVLCLPELCLTGVSCGELFYQKSLLTSAVEALLWLTSGSRGELLTFVGLPLPFDGQTYNCVAAIQNGVILGISPKRGRSAARLLSNAPAVSSLLSLEGVQTPFGRVTFTCQTLPSLSVGVYTGEDIFTEPVGASDASLLVNPFASPEYVGLYTKRRRALLSLAERYNCAVVHASAGEGESCGEAVYAGARLVIERGEILAESRRFSTGLTISEIDVEVLESSRRRAQIPADVLAEPHTRVGFNLEQKHTALSRYVSPTPFVPGDESLLATRCEEVLQISSYALAQKLISSGLKRVVLGLSGGVDSAAALMIATRAMPVAGLSAENIICVLMPGFGTGSRTYANSRALAEKTGVTVREIDIRATLNQHFADIGYDPKEQTLVFENAQARQRTHILLDIANAEGGLTLGTGDLSESALGFCTYGGDNLAHYNVNGSIPKSLIRKLVSHCALIAGDDGLREVLNDIVDTPISPELLPLVSGRQEQETEKILGPYEVNDFFLYYVMRFGFTPPKILRIAEYAFNGKYSAEELREALKRFYRRFFSSQFKRAVSPESPRIGYVAFGKDAEIPSDASAAMWLRELEQQESKA